MQRLPVWRDRVREPLAEVLSKARAIREAASKWTREQKEAAAKIAKLVRAGGREGGSIEEAAIAHEYPFHTIMWPVAQEIAGFLATRKDVLFAFAPEGRGFITTDNPCIRIDLAGDRSDALYPPGLADPQIAVLFPLAPACAMFLHNTEPKGGVISEATEALVDDWNHMLVSASTSAFVYSSERVPGL
jgi:hypothetical protein